MSGTPHEVAAALHSRWLDRDLEPEGERRLAAHRAGCPECEAAFAEMERLAEALAGLERFEPRAGFADRVLAAVRPAPVPAWARWRISTTWGRAAAIALLAGASLVFLGAAAALGLALKDVGSPGMLFRGPGLVVEGFLVLLRQLDPLRAIVEVAAVLGRALLVAAASPQVLLGLVGSAAVSAGAFFQLSHILAAPQRRHSSHA